MGMRTAPLWESFNIFSKRIVESGVSRKQRISFLFSFNATWAARVIKESAMPEAIFESVEAEQGTMTMALKLFEPEAKGEERSSSEKTFFA